MTTITECPKSIHEKVKYTNLILKQIHGKVENLSASFYVRYNYSNNTHVFNFKIN